MAVPGLPLDTSDKDTDNFGDDAAFMIKYADDQTVNFIGLSSSETYDCSIYDIDPFDTLAVALFALLAECNGTIDTPLF